MVRASRPVLAARRLATAPTMLPMTGTSGAWPGPAGAVAWRYRRDAEHDLDGLAIDLNPAHEVTDDGARARPVEFGEPAAHLGGQVLHPADHQRPAASGLGRFDERPPSLLRMGEPLPQAGDAGPELAALDHPPPA